MTTTFPTLLLILDGWGIAPESDGNAVTRACTPTLDALVTEYPTAKLACSGRAVGLPDGFMGNSEVGHMNIGAGRVIYQDMTRIDIAIEDGSFMSNPVLVDTIAKTKAAGGKLHLMGLVSDGGVHSHNTHIYALLKLAKASDVDVVVHAFLDGRDTPPSSGAEYVKQLEEAMHSIGTGRIATVSGRYYAMDRDQRWERNKLAWDCLVLGKGIKEDSALAAVEHAYAAGETDEFVKPRVVSADDSIADNDGVFFFNFRADRARQLARAFFDTSFTEFDRERVPSLAALSTMTSYDGSFPLPIAFPKTSPDNTLGELISANSLKQLRIAETEKYAHVTYFFNCGREEPFEGEDRVLVQSPREVATYDLKPEMSVHEVTDKLLDAIESEKYSVLVCNLANLDMVGHTGIIPAAMDACVAVDGCVERIIDAVKAKGGVAMVTADHGNAEELIDPSGNPQTAHSKNPVPFVLIDEHARYSLRGEGILGDIAPTILELVGIQQPADMTGTSLLVAQEK